MVLTTSWCCSPVECSWFELPAQYRSLILAHPINPNRILHCENQCHFLQKNVADESNYWKAIIPKNNECQKKTSTQFKALASIQGHIEHLWFDSMKIQSYISKSKTTNHSILLHHPSVKSFNVFLFYMLVTILRNYTVIHLKPSPLFSLWMTRVEHSKTNLALHIVPLSVYILLSRTGTNFLKNCSLKLFPTACRMSFNNFQLIFHCKAEKVSANTETVLYSLANCVSNRNAHMYNSMCIAMLACNLHRLPQILFLHILSLSVDIALHMFAHNRN